MSGLNLSEIVQPPSLSHPPVALSLPANSQQNGGLYNDGQFSWTLTNQTLHITNTATGECVQNWSSPDYNITHVCQLKANHKGQSSLLVLALEGSGLHIIGVLSSQGVKLIRGILIPGVITALHTFSYQGFPPSRETDGFSRPDIFQNSVLSLFNGIIAVGTHGGRVYLVDLQLGVVGGMSESIFSNRLTSPSHIHVIEGPVSGQDMRNISESSHVAVDISRESLHNGQFVYLKSAMSPASLSVTAIYFATQISSLFVGYSFGGFQIYDLSTFQLMFSSPISTPPTPVTHFTYIEPENDPRKFVYVWVVRGESPFIKERSSCETKASLYQMIFSEKTPPTIGFSPALYRGFQRCGIRLEYAFTPTPSNPNPLSSPGSHVIACDTIVRHRKEHDDHSDELDLSLAVFVWSVSESDVFIGLFDVNQWYQAQMPNAVRRKRSGKYTGVFGCSYFSFYTLKPVLQNTGKVLDVLVDRCLPFHSQPPVPETFMWPSALQFSVRALSSTTVSSCWCLGLQRMALHELDMCRGSLYAQPERLFQLCVKTELIPPTWDHGSMADLSFQKAALLNVVINNGCPTRILTTFADSWLGAGGDDPVISQWVELKKAELTRVKDSICNSVFECSPPLITPSTHWRKMAAINIFLERLVGDGLEQDGRTGPMFESIAELYCTVALHKKIMEVLMFLNEQGLVSDYPAAALRRRYDMLRGMGDQANKLAVDYLYEDLHGNDEECVYMYPPRSLASFLDVFLTSDLLLQHCLMVYLLCDLGSLKDGDLNLSAVYASTQEVPASLVTAVQGLWMVDNRKYKDPAYKNDVTLLFRTASNPPLFPWQHSVVAGSLMSCGEVCLALQYVQIHGGDMQGMEEVKLKLNILVGNNLICGAYELLRQFEGSEFYDDLFSFFLECCIEGKCLHHLLDLSLSPKAENCAVLYLEQHSTLACRELLVFYFLARHRIVEALAMQEKIRPFAKSDPDPSALIRSSQRDTLLAGLAAVVPNTLHHVKLSRDKGQSLKVKVQVDKSLSSVVAKAMRDGSVSTHGGAIYSLIQSIAEKRSTPAEPFTPFKVQRESITNLSHAPFLSTPVSVKIMRSHPLTSNRPHPLVTPTPRSRPITPLASHTHQKFVSHVQGFRDRMASLLSQSGSRMMDVSSVQTPSPASSVLMTKPFRVVTTPPSILKGKRTDFSDTKLTDKKIRFTVEDKPLEEAITFRHAPFTPAVASSLSTTTTVAMSTPLPVSDDSDQFESPVESPSQLDNSLLRKSLSPTATKLQFEDEATPRKEAAGLVVEDEATPRKEAAGLVVEDEDAPQKEGSGPIFEESVGMATDESSFVEEGSSDDEVQGIVPDRSHLKGALDKLTRDKITSSVSLKIKPITADILSPVTVTTKTQTGNVAASLFSSPFSPVTMSTKPSHTPKPSVSSTSSLFTPVSTATSSVSQLFSPVPYLSDLIQAKRDRLRSSIELTKQRDVASIKASTMHSTKTSTVGTPKTFSQSASSSKASFSATMVRSSPFSPVVMPTTSTTQYSFTPPTQVPIDAHHSSAVSESEPMSFVFSPPLTRSAARRQSLSKESSVEPTDRTKKRGKGRPRKSVLPSTDDNVMLVTPPTAPRPLKETTGKQRTRAKPVKSGVGSRRSARLLGGKK